MDMTYRISQKLVHPSHFFLYFIISFHVTTLKKLHFATNAQNIATLSPTWTFSLRGVLSFYFEGTANLHCYTSYTLSTLHCSKVSFLQCCHMKIYNKIFTQM